MGTASNFEIPKRFYNRGLPPVVRSAFDQQLPRPAETHGGVGWMGSLQTAPAAESRAKPHDPYSFPWVKSRTQKSKRQDT